jgi:hypothetical protein
VIVATNALRLRVDMLDIRVVIYVGQPRKLRDYSQASGRARRDGKSSEASLFAVILSIDRQAIGLNHGPNPRVKTVGIIAAWTVNPVHLRTRSLRS